MNGPHRYGTGIRYGTDHTYGETAEIFTGELASSPSYVLSGGFGSGDFGDEFFGSDGDGATTVTYATESASSPSYITE